MFMRFSTGKLLPLCLMLFGLVLIVSVIAPIAVPRPGSKLIDPTDVSEFPLPVVVDEFGSPTQLSNSSEWFTAPISLPPAKVTSVRYFSLAIPRLKLLNVPVEVNGADLKTNAIHYPGTALPGEYGNSVVFGHSALPQFYTKDNPLTVFNSLVDARVGDEIIVNFDGITYRYLVTKITEITPSQVEVLTQSFDRRALTLITCVPLGTYWHRLVIHAEIAKS